MYEEGDNFQKGELLIYRSEDGKTKVDAYFEEDTVWLSQSAMATLFQKTSQNITQHIKNIYSDGELDEVSTCKTFLQVQNEGGRSIKRNIKYYNLSIILAVGYRVRSHRGNQFRNWASEVLTEYMKKGFVMNDDRLKNPKKFGADYFDELLERIRDIRASEKRFYQKVQDIYALSVDYDPKVDLTREFFATVQNKLHYSVHGRTAAELIVERADAFKDNMGLSTYEGSKVRKSDVTIAKNYLNQEEITALNRIVTMYLDYAEDMARQQIPMYMKDWVEALDNFLKFNRRELLTHAGKISRELAEKKAHEQYEIYNQHRIKQADEAATDEIDELEKLK
ncbi:MAG: virulence RhuM family protein [Syntrophomonas sp.]|uniref:virulence RhuM family protein n=1 Tax=Syntrophomonas sp. TaxID=2053627 RepID=UPI00261EC36F|nr:virulence RhuM family protein [Syntrophomonas sp.]MDD2509914.1 virulence RhuM family protein [Syntrophomonas sp.]MDD3878676.1 virulence RhuM family protein [Syntrophomonas sp.]MDD4626042.1 virulence RhuM family protein [Syntrophomonas sp.]